MIYCTMPRYWTCKQNERPHMTFWPTLFQSVLAGYLLPGSECIVKIEVQLVDCTSIFKIYGACRYAAPLLLFILTTPAIFFPPLPRPLCRGWPSLPHQGWPSAPFPCPPCNPPPRRDYPPPPEHVKGEV